jgi:hypothetical protein
MVVMVPHAFLYERSLKLPSKWNAQHECTFTPATLLLLFECALEPNSYRVRHLMDNDRDYKYDLDPGLHPQGCYEIEIVIQKIVKPFWGIEK